MIKFNEQWLWERLQGAKKPVVLYGMGNGADKIRKVCGEKKIPVAGVFASDGFCRNHEYNGFTVTTYEQAKAVFGDMIVLLCFGTGRQDVIQNIERIAVEQELYAPDVPVYGHELFDESHWRLNQSSYNEAFELLTDIQSQKTFMGLLQYRASGKIEYLKNCEASAEEAYESILKLSDTETYLDGGAYTGDTVQEFLRHVRGHNRILAVEPDARNFAKLIKNTQDLENIACLKIGLHSRKGEMHFASRAGRHASLDEASNNVVPADTIDNILDGGAVTFIKMDVEGQEIQAILGAQNTIAAYKPKLQIAAYHKTDDLFAIPLCIKKTRPDYRVYIRHTTCIPAWDTSYYFV
ncbi:MAG: FkbM family methyltransferase [Eubacteriales bacterium]